LKTIDGILNKKLSWFENIVSIKKYICLDNFDVIVYKNKKIIKLRESYKNSLKKIKNRLNILNEYSWEILKNIYIIYNYS
jgi:DNA integrity scanning protein DisA with diadenylate cyclase activity